MGSTTAMGIKDSVDRGWIQMRVAMEQHLVYNHYPPIPRSMIEPCLQAVEAGNDGDWNRIIDLPEGITYRAGKDVPYVEGKKVDENGNLTYATASALIDAHHLEWFIDCEEDY
jgi:hypothetical protein